RAEDGIRDFHVTGVQTCALPICRPAGHAGTYDPGIEARTMEPWLTDALRRSPHRRRRQRRSQPPDAAHGLSHGGKPRRPDPTERSEERRVGEACSRGSYAYHGTE